MKKVIEGIYIGDQNDFPEGNMACVHAAKNPFHADAVGYKGSLDKNHPYYLIYRKPDNLYLNMIDPKFELPAEFTDPMFNAAIIFIATAIVNDKSVLVRCNKGMSRSPSIVLVYLAKAGMITNHSFQDAKKEFLELYPDYSPGDGISLYLEKNWSKLTE